MVLFTPCVYVCVCICLRVFCEIQAWFLFSLPQTEHLLEQCNTAKHLTDVLALRTFMKIK